MFKRILITGGAGFIGSALIRHLLGRGDGLILNVDKLTYAGHLTSLQAVAQHSHYAFVQADICDQSRLEEIFQTFQPDAVIHLAAESHVDKSIDGAGDFIQTNVFGVFSLLETVRHYLKTSAKAHFRLLHLSTDEVFGDLGDDGKSFNEQTPYAPNSPYSASKASGDCLMRAWLKTHDVPIVMAHCCNNYGAFQFPEKLIPHVIICALLGQSLPIYGDGLQKRDWLLVDEHVRALDLLLHKGRVGECYCIGGDSVLTNLAVVQKICAVLAQRYAQRDFYRLIEFVADRAGHDRHYAVDFSKIKRELGWQPLVSFDEGLRQTVAWYVDNQDWWQAMIKGSYRLARQGLGA